MRVPRHRSFLERCNSFRATHGISSFHGPRFRSVRPDLPAAGTRTASSPMPAKGAVGRATTLLFPAAISGVIGDESRELQADRLSVSVAWHQAEPVGEWERPRNATIAEIQGNRNALIDHPGWEARIPFESAFGAPRRCGLTGQE